MVSVFDNVIGKDPAVYAGAKCGMCITLHKNRLKIKYQNVLSKSKKSKFEASF